MRCRARPRQQAHLLLGEHTGGSAAYVAMTRGRERNTVHIVADTVDEAREQWIAAFQRDRADLGPAHAAQQAAREAARYATGRPLPELLEQLRTAWTREQNALDVLARAEPAVAGGARGRRDPDRARHPTTPAP